MKKKPAPTLNNALASMSLVFGSLLTQHASLIDKIPGTFNELINTTVQAKEVAIYPDFSCNNTVVGIQVGHWNNQNPPTELAFISHNTGASGAGKMEWESNYLVAIESKNLLEAHGIKVDLLEAVIPPQYKADVVVSIHADGSKNESLNGFKVAPPERDRLGRSGLLAEKIRASYVKTTGMAEDANNITENMTDYYAFSPQRFNHAIDPATPAALLETGFLSSPADQTLLVHQPQLPGEGLAYGIIAYLATQPESLPCEDQDIV